MHYTVTDTLMSTDTLKHAGGSDSSWILGHVMDSHTLDFEPFFTIQLPRLELFGIDISITKYIFFMWVVALLLFFILFIVSRKYRSNLIPNGISNLVEITVLFVRDEIVKPTIGKGYERFLPYLLTVFFFILLSNFFGLIPYAVTVTGNIAVTAALAGISFIAIQIGGIKSQGTWKYFKGLVPSGMPPWILIILIPLEILGLFTKPFALCIRLFANMIAGHVVILSLLGLIFILQTAYVAPVSIAFAIFIYLLELLVALIQAYIFTILTSLFIGMAVHQEH